MDSSHLADKSMGMKSCICIRALKLHDPMLFKGIVGVIWCRGYVRQPCIFSMLTAEQCTIVQIYRQGHHKISTVVGTKTLLKPSKISSFSQLLSYQILMYSTPTACNITAHWQHKFWKCWEPNITTYLQHRVKVCQSYSAPQVLFWFLKAKLGD